MSQSDAEAEGGRNTLVILLHSYTLQTGDLASVEEAVHEVWPKAEVFRPQLPASLLSMADPNRIVAELVADVDRIVQEAEEHGRAYKKLFS